jgi:hypothetical protein
LLRPIERFLAQCISISTEPSAFVRERIRLGDTTNFLRAAGFFLSAISTAFLAEVATLYLLGIGNLTEPYYWLFILLTTIPFVLFCFLLVRFVAPLSFKDVLHLSLYPIGAGVFAGAAFALVASAVVASLVAVGFIPEIKYDFTHWGGAEQMIPVNKRALHDCLRGESLAYTILSTGLQAAYNDLKPPIDSISYFRPVIGLLYLVIAARFFMTAVDRRKWVVFGMVLLAALVATGANIVSLKAYFEWNLEKSGCGEQVASGQLGLDLTAESALKEFARGVDADMSKPSHTFWNLSVRAEGRTLIFNYRANWPILDMRVFHSWVSERQKQALERYCSEDGGKFLRSVKAVETHRYFSSLGERLTSFSIGPADCPQW